MWIHAFLKTIHEFELSMSTSFSTLIFITLLVYSTTIITESEIYSISLQRRDYPKKIILPPLKHMLILYFDEIRPIWQNHPDKT